MEIDCVWADGVLAVGWLFGEDAGDIALTVVVAVLSIAAIFFTTRLGKAVSAEMERQEREEAKRKAEGAGCAVSGGDAEKSGKPAKVLRPR